MKSNNNNKNIPSLDERESYFSYILSPYNMNNHHEKKQVDRHLVEKAIKQGDCEICNGDVNCEAEVYIRQQHRKLKNCKTFPEISIE
ncbi:Aspartyl/glutamyl-tRNA(Asn/Gln) amidotransferase subunit B [Bienertia sinuspersici]